MDVLGGCTGLGSCYIRKRGTRLEEEAVLHFASGLRTRTPSVPRATSRIPERTPCQAPACRKAGSRSGTRSRGCRRRRCCRPGSGLPGAWICQRGLALRHVLGRCTARTPIDSAGSRTRAAECWRAQTHCHPAPGPGGRGARWRRAGWRASASRRETRWWSAPSSAASAKITECPYPALTDHCNTRLGAGDAGTGSRSGCRACEGS